MIPRLLVIVSVAVTLVVHPAAQAPTGPPAPPDSGAAVCDAQLPHDATSGPEKLAALVLGGRPMDATGRRAFTGSGWAPEDMTRTLARAILRQRATPAQRQAWSSCLDSQTRGISVYVVEDSPAAVSAEVSYHGAAGEAPRVRLDVEGGRIDNTYKTKFVRVKDGEGVMVAITRETPQSHVAIFANADNGKWDDAIALAPGVDVRAARQPPERFLGGGTKLTTSNGTASATNATDGDVKTSWNAGGMPPQWIEIALTPAKTVTQVQLIIEQRPRGVTKHTVRGYRADGSQVTLGFFWLTTDAGTEMSARIAPAVGRGLTRVRVETESGPSWVAWREVRLFGY